MKNNLLFVLLATVPVVFGAELTPSDNNAVPLVRIGGIVRPFRFRKVRLGMFFQASYSEATTSAHGIDPVYGPIQYQEYDKNPNVTLGLDVEYRLRPGLFAVVRIGRNLGDGYAATEGGGFSLNGGLSIDPIRAVRFVGKLF